MTTQQDIISHIEQLAPLRLQEDYDNSGLQVGDPRREAKRILVSLDVTEETVAEAEAIGADIIVSHHPLLFRPARRITREDYVGRTVIAAIQAGITLYAAHTNLDNAPGGVNSKMAAKLGLVNVRPLAPLPAQRTAGMADDVAARCGSGVIGTLPEAIDERAFVAHVKSVFHCAALRHSTAPRPIRTVALCGGAGSFLIGEAVRAGADAYLTGEVGYHAFFGHPELLIAEAGHYETEQYTCDLIADTLRTAFPDVDCRITTQPAQPAQID